MHIVIKIGVMFCALFLASCAFADVSIQCVAQVSTQSILVGEPVIANVEVRNTGTVDIVMSPVALSQRRGTSAYLLAKTPSDGTELKYSTCQNCSEVKDVAYLPFVLSPGQVLRQREILWLTGTDPMATLRVDSAGEWHFKVRVGGVQYQLPDGTRADILCESSEILFTAVEATTASDIAALAMTKSAAWRQSCFDHTMTNEQFEQLRVAALSSAGSAPILATIAVREVQYRQATYEQRAAAMAELLVAADVPQNPTRAEALLTAHVCFTQAGMAVNAATLKEKLTTEMASDVMVQKVSW